MAFAPLAAHDVPLSDVNTTPLIDVMLVLLTMLMLSIPLSTHSLDYDLPTGDPPPEVILEPLRNRLTIDPADRIAWNGAPIALGDLAAILEQDVAMVPEPTLEFAPDAAARYALSAEVLRQIKASGVTNFGFVGNEQHRAFGR